MAPVLQRSPYVAVALAATLAGLRLTAARIATLPLPPTVRTTMLSVASGVSLCGTVYLVMLLAKNVLLVPGQLLPAILVSKFVADREQRIEAFLARRSTAERVKVPVDDGTGTVLDAVEIRTQTTMPTTKWVVWFNANGVIYEQILDFLDEYSSRLRCNVIVFNYRGVGSSSGWPNVSNDLKADAIAVLNHVLAKPNVREEGILLHGHSLGGAVSAMAAADHPLCRRVNDRSFRSLKEEVSELMAVGLGGLMGLLFGLVVGTSYYVVTWAGGEPLEAGQHALLTCWLGGAVLGVALNKGGIIAAMSPYVVDLIGWRMNARQLPWPAETTLVLYHEYDEVIPYHGASLHHHLITHGTSPVNGLQLLGHGQNVFRHMYPLNQEAPEWEAVLARVRAIFP